MSIINQALQKAQREQLRHSQQEMPYRLSAQRTRAPRRRWLLALLGLVAAVGVGVTLHAWFLIPTGRVPVPTELASTSSPLVTPIPPATPLPATPVVEPGTEPPLPERHARPLPLGSEPPPLAPVVASADTPPMPIAIDSTPPLTGPPPTPPSAAMPLPRVAPPAVPAPAEVARAQALVQRAAAAQEAKELPRALTLLEQAIKLDPTAKAAYNSLGNVYYQQHRYAESVQQYEKALALNGKDYRVWINLALADRWLGRDEQAIAAYRRALPPPARSPSTVRVKSPGRSTSTETPRMRASSAMASGRILELFLEL